MRLLNKMSAPRRRGSKACTAIMAITLALTTHAAPVRQEHVDGYRFQIVTADDSELTRRIADDLGRRLVPVFAGFRTELAQQRRMLYVAVGPAALREVAARHCDCVAIAAFTSSQVFRAIVDQLPSARAGAITAVYAEPAPSDQLRLAALLYRRPPGRPLHVASILGADTAFLKPALAADGVSVLDVAPGDDINRLLNRIDQADVLLALPDSTIYNPENFRNILLSTYRHKQGVIGFSSDMVKAGALATTYSEIEDIDAQVAEIAAAYVAGGELSAPQFPHYFRTAVNEGVARSLELDVLDAVRRFARPAPALAPGAASTSAPRP